jgi:glycosyltransferase involved in cell wall biosynthesis
MISIISVNWNSYDFLELLIESLERYSSLSYELIVIDNSVKKQQIIRDSVFQYMMPENIGHGQGLNEGVKLTKFPFVMFLDVDTHILCHNWEEPFLKMMEEFDVVGGRGVPAKPIRPACMFMKREFSFYDWRASEGYKGERGEIQGFDVAIQAYHQMLKDGVRIKLLEHIPSRYETIVGEEFCIDGVPICYHHWHGSHIKERQIDFPNCDLTENKELLFSQIPWRFPW